MSEKQTKADLTGRGRISFYSFKTGWVTIQPGTDDSIEVNGFVLLNHDKTEMAVYHLWGE